MHSETTEKHPALRRTATFVAFFTVVLLVTAISGCNKPDFPLIEQKCGTCHSATIVYEKNLTEQRWQQVLHGMKKAGLKLTETEEQQIMSILLENFSTTR